MNSDPADTHWRLAMDPPDDARRESWWRRLPGEPAMMADGMFDPARYRVNVPLIDAFNTALLLGQPLLLTGEPGCGKTEAAHYLAWRLGLTRPGGGGRTEYARRFNTKSTTQSQDLFYSFDVVGRFHAAQSKGDPNPENFISLQPLGRAILDACATDAAKALRTKLDGKDYGLRRSVVLIDEIDKAPRDTPNDLLVEFERMEFTLRDLNLTFRAQPDLQPIIILTSNRERGLPDAFLRRCVFHAMEFPEDGQLAEIVKARLGERHPGVEDSLEPLLKVFNGLRDPHENLRRPPGTAELLGFVAAVADAGLRTAQEIRASNTWHAAAQMILLKDNDDQKQVRQGNRIGALLAR
jgi:MoxR-like ATPase